MNEIENGTATGADVGARARRRQYRITARLLREYTTRVYRIADHVVAYLDAVRRRAATVLLTQTALTAVARYRVVWEEVADAALYASGMLVHSGLDEAEAAELRIRLRDAEHAVARAGGLVHEATSTDPATFGSAIKGGRMAAVLQQSREFLPR